MRRPKRDKRSELAVKYCCHGSSSVLAYILEGFPGKRLKPCDQGLGIYFLRGIASDASASAYAVTAITAAFSFNCRTFTLSRVSAAE